MRYTKHEEIKMAIVITKENLKHLYDFIYKHFEKIHFTGKTIDNTIIKFNNIDDLLSFNNPTKNRLIKLEIKCVGNNKSMEIYFPKRFANGIIGSYAVVSYRIDYDNKEWGHIFRYELIEILKEFKPYYYNYLAYLNFILVLLLLFLLLGTLYINVDFIIKLLGTGGYINYEQNNQIYVPKIIGWFFIFLLIFIGYILEKIKNYLFPKVFIALGMQ